VSEAAPRYSWGVPSARGVALGLGPGRLLALGGGLVATTLTFYLRLPVMVAVLPAAAGCVWAWAPGGAGRSLHETAVAGGGLSVRRLRARPAPLPVVGFGGQVAEPWWPRELGRLRVEPVPVDGNAWGVVVESGRHRAATATAVFAVLGDPRFRLLPEVDQAAAVSGWAQVLAEAAVGSSIAHLQWLERARPQPRPEPIGPAGYQAMVAEAAGQAVEHRSLVAAQVRLAGGDGWTRAVGAWRLLVARMAAAGLCALPLGPAALAGTLREWASGRAGGCDPALAGPGVWSESWRLVRTAGRCHRAWAVVAWPRTLVGPAWLDPLLAAVPEGVERTVSVHLQAVPTPMAVRRLRAARTGHMVEEEHRARLGFVAPVGDLRRGEETEAREGELAAGYVLHRVAGLVMMSAGGEERLEEAGDEMVAAAAAAGLDLRPLDGCHGPAWAAALPACRLGWRGRT
jgi:hypothetical protein